MCRVSAIEFDPQIIQIEFQGTFWNVRFADVEILQSTGLTDKNGNLIYEGDILRRLDEAYSVDEIIPVHRHTHVTNIGFWHGKEYEVRNATGAQDNNDDWMSWPEEYEVIGNIYEHSHLLPKA